MITVKIDPVSLNAPLNEPHEGLKRYSPKNWSLFSEDSLSRLGCNSLIEGLLTHKALSSLPSTAKKRINQCSCCAWW
jgi:hypothetical protein